MNQYLTYQPDSEGRLGLWCGPDIKADNWDQAEERLQVLIAFNMAHPKTYIIGELYHEEEWAGYYDRSVT